MPASETDVISSTVDPWNSFAPITPKCPNVVSRIVDRLVDFVDRVARHEAVLAALASSAFACVMTWPIVAHPTTALPGDLTESAQDAVRLSWAGHCLTTDPMSLLSANILYPDEGLVAATGRLLGLAPTGLLGTGTTAAILRYNILFVLAFAFATFGGYVLARQLGIARMGSTVAAVAFAFAPWRLAQGAHLDILSVGGLALSLAMLARGYGWSPGKHHDHVSRHHVGWILGGWLVAAWQISLSADIGVPFSYILAVIVLVMLGSWVGHRYPRPRLLSVLVSLLGISITAASTVGMAILAGRLPHVTQAEDLAEFSVPLWGFLAAPAESLLWGSAHTSVRDSLAIGGQGAALPGFFLLALAVTGLVVSTWRWQQRLWIAMGVGLSAVLAMGTFGPDNGWLGFLSLWRSVPGFRAVDNPSSMLVWVTLTLALLAAGAVDVVSCHIAAVRGRMARMERVLARRAATAGRRVVVGTRRRGLARVALRATLVLPLLLVAVEGLPSYSAEEVAEAPAGTLAALAEVTGPALVLPTGVDEDAATMLWSVEDFPVLANGTSQPTSEDLALARSVASSFPSSASVAAFTALGVRTVVVLRGLASQAGYASGIEEVDKYLVDSLGLTVEETSDVLIFTLPST